MNSISKTWHVVIRDIDSAELHFSHAVQLFDRLKAASKADEVYIAEMAFQHAMQSGYTSVEAAIKRIFHTAGEPLPVGPSTHKELLRDAFEAYEDRPAIFTAPDVKRNLQVLRGFRHVAAHAYDDFEPDLAAPAALAALSIKGKLKSQILEFIGKFDPLTQEEKPLSPSRPKE